MQERDIEMMRLLAEDLDGNGAQALIDIADRAEANSKQVADLRGLLSRAREAIHEMRTCGMALDNAWANVVKSSPVVSYDADAGRALNIARQNFIRVSGVAGPAANDTH